MDNYTSTSVATTNSTSEKLHVFYWEQIFTSVLIELIAIAGIIGNSMIIVAVAFSRKLQTTSNAFVTSLAVADLLSSIFLIYFGIGLLGKNGWLIPQAYWLCQLTAFMIYASIGTSLYTLGAIAINRLILITKPILYRKIFTSWKLVILVTIPWIIPGGIVTTILLTGSGEVGYDSKYLTCTRMNSDSRAEALNHTQTIVGFVIPFLAIAVSYAWIYVYLKTHFRAKKLRLWGSTSSIPGNILNCEPASSSGQQVSISQTVVEKSYPRVAAANRHREQISRQQIEITKNLFLVVCAFVICFLPFFVFNALQKFIQISGRFMFYARIPSFVNSAINFVIYASKHPDFKVVLRHMIRFSYTDIPQPSRLLKFILSKGK